MKIYANITNDEINEKYRLISRNVKRIRQSKQISQTDVALAMGFTTATFYTNAENNKQDKHFNLEHIIKLAEIFKVDISDFFKE